MLLLHPVNFPVLLETRSFSAAAAVNVPVLLETGVLVLLLHYRKILVQQLYPVGDRSFSAAAAL